MLFMLRCRPCLGLRSSTPITFAVGLACALGMTPLPARAITGVCPDGSVFVVRSRADVPCADAKRVESHQVPPLRPENLSRPYLWQVHRERTDENNPYNLVDRAAQVRGAGVGAAAQPPEEIATAAPGGGAAAQAGLPQVASAPPARPSAPAPPRTLGLAELGLTDGDLRDLFLLVELSQERTAATFLRAGAGGPDSLRVSLAWSQAFESRAREASRADGTVLLFSVQPKSNEAFLPNFTFVQQHLSFAPRREDATQLGVLSGRLGPLAPDELVLGYVVLPGAFDASRPIDVYWDDRRLAATFQ